MYAGLVNEQNTVKPPSREHTGRPKVIGYKDYTSINFAAQDESLCPLKWRCPKVEVPLYMNDV